MRSSIISRGKFREPQACGIKSPGTRVPSAHAGSARSGSPPRIARPDSEGVAYWAGSALRPSVADFPASARAVVIGGGIVGCSTAYHLAKLGWRDTIIVERHKLSSGSTHHAAGLVGQLRSSAN